jgi:hypothetical protein
MIPFAYVLDVKKQLKIPSLILVVLNGAHNPDHALKKPNENSHLRGDVPGEF